MTAAQTVAKQTAVGLASRYRWPAPLLPAVLEAIGTADPDGIDAFAEEADWWAAIDEKLAEVQATLPAAEQAFLRPLRDVSIQGAGGARYGVGEVAADVVDQGRLTAQAAADVAAPVVEAATSARTVGMGAALLALLGWLFLRDKK